MDSPDVSDITQDIRINLKYSKTRVDYPSLNVFPNIAWERAISPIPIYRPSHFQPPDSETEYSMTGFEFERWNISLNIAWWRPNFGSKIYLQITARSYISECQPLENIARRSLVLTHIMYITYFIRGLWYSKTDSDFHPLNISTSTAKHLA